MKKTAMIIGATGLVGEKCLQYLIQSNAYDSVIALTRRKLSVNHPKLNNIVLDFDALEENVSCLMRLQTPRCSMTYWMTLNVSSI